jgi:hypothetical protein
VSQKNILHFKTISLNRCKHKFYSLFILLFLFVILVNSLNILSFIPSEKLNSNKFFHELLSQDLLNIPESENPNESEGKEVIISSNNQNFFIFNSHHTCNRIQLTDNVYFDPFSEIITPPPRVH